MMEIERVKEILKSMKADCVPKSAIMQREKNEAIDMAIKAMENKDDLEDCLRIARGHAKRSAEDADKLMNAWNRVKHEIETCGGMTGHIEKGEAIGIIDNCIYGATKKMTNREKFKEVFGFMPNEDAECVAPTKICYIHDEICNDCPFDEWWFKEYKPCFQIKEGLDD